MKVLSELGRAVLFGVALTCVIAFVLYDVGFNGSAWCNMAIDKFLSFVETFARQLNHWGTELFGQYQYQVPR